MTHDRHEPESIQNVTYALAQDRIADLRASVSTVDSELGGLRVAVLPGIVARTRDAVGRRLIELGGSVVADETLRQRALHL